MGAVDFFVLTIPEITPEMSTLDAALAYADAGWFLSPTNPCCQR